MNRMKKTAVSTSPVLTALLAGVLSVGTVYAQTATTDRNTTATTTTTTTTTATTDAGARKLDRTDANFLKDAAQGGLAEVEGGKAALNKATHPDVKAFAQMLIDDHTKANSELAALASMKNVKLPTEPTMMDKAKLKVLTKRDGDSFDKHFIKSLGVEAHEDTIKRFEKITRDGKDADVRAFASKTLPTLQHHLQMAKDLHAKLDPKDAKK